MEDLMLRLKAQYIERIIWIVVILILLIALVVVSVYKTENCAPGDTPTVEEETPVAAPPAEEEPPAPAPKPEEKPAPATPPPAGLSGQITFSIDRLDCQAMSAAGNLTRAKINSVGMNLENGKSTDLRASLTIYLWDAKEDSDKDIARTGEKPVLIGTLAPGKTFNDFLNVRSKPTTYLDVEHDHYFKGEVVDDTGTVVASKTVKFKTVNGQCSII